MREYLRLENPVFPMFLESYLPLIDSFVKKMYMNASPQRQQGKNVLPTRVSVCKTLDHRILHEIWEFGTVGKRYSFIAIIYDLNSKNLLNEQNKMFVQGFCLSLPNKKCNL